MTRRRHTRRWLLAGGVLVVVAAAGLGTWWLLTSRMEPPSAAVDALASAWSRGQIAEAPFLDAPTDLANRYDELTAGLDARPPGVRVLAVRAPGQDDARSTSATLEITWEPADAQPWVYQTTAQLQLVEDRWRVQWRPSLFHPRLGPDLRLATRRLQPERGDVLAADGTALVTERPVVDVGVQPSRATDPAALASTLEEVLGIDGAALEERIAAASADAFVPVITLREEDYLAVEDQIYELPGTVFRRDRLPLAPTRDFARAVLGRAGPVTAEILDEHPERYARGDVVGLSALQSQYDDRLFGEPGLQVVVTGEQPPEDPVLFEVPPVPGADVTITLDEAVQLAAEAAVADTGFPTALLAMRISDGHILAAANNEQAGGFNLAFRARVPPGSTFKIVTTVGLLRDGLAVDDTVPCAASTTIEGRTITNAEDQVLGDVPFRTAFARSCNTAFVALSQRLQPEALTEAASDFGIGHELDLGVEAFSGEVPATEGALDLAVAAIGQGRNVVSPLAMAGVAATVASAAWTPPVFVLEPSPGAGPTLPPPLDAAIASSLQDLTRLVVTDGSGAAVRDVPGGPVHGKTGTAEYGSEQPPRTHAWFVGYQGDLAVAVLVAETEAAFGGTTAAPIAADFLTALAAGAAPPVSGSD